MEITEVRIKLVDSSSDKLRAFCSITIDDCFVIRDLKIIDGTKGAFVTMPSRKMTAKCRRCNCKNYTRAKFCNDCGGKLPVVRSEDDDGRGKGMWGVMALMHVCWLLLGVLWVLCCFVPL